MRYKLGKTDARPPMGLRFADVFNVESLPTPPATFGHANLIPGGLWGMLDNDSIGDCTICDVAHQHMLWTLEGGGPGAQFAAKDVAADYFSLTGGADTGLDMQVVAAWRQKTGILDVSGIRHKTQGSVSLKAGNLPQLSQAAYIFGAVSVGVQLPSSAEAQFDAAKPWSVMPGDTIEGGHCITVIGKNSAGNYLVVSWGKLQAATPAWLETYMDEGLPSLSIEMLNAKGVSPEAYDLAALQKYLGAF